MNDAKTRRKSSHQTKQKFANAHQENKESAKQT
jgi:hypothetical protein